MLNAVDTKNPAAVAAFATKAFHELFPGAGIVLIERAFTDVETHYSGRHPGYLPIDLGYHDLEHVMQATVCLVHLLQGAHRAGEGHELTPRQYELAIAGALLHDTGYLKIRTDVSGTGAKYTLTHVLRSCAFAASYLPTIGVQDQEVFGVLGAINCTGPANEIGRLNFNTPADRFIGCALATADYLGQMAAPDYPEKLGVLFNEFLESDNFMALPQSRRVFKSAEDLMQKTPDFWNKFVKPRLETQLDRAYRYLARPFPNGPNEYYEAVERNIEIVRQRLAAKAATR
ncbi:MAG: hypothetical protein JSR48_07550 [Verrucomicrobia bacterium]|nr:hypothetical protein [Verrucomicrobiota bacterium]